MTRAFHANAKAFDNLRRYTTPIERAYHRAIAELTKLQKERKKSEIGSVSQPAPAPAPALEIVTGISPDSMPPQRYETVINTLKDDPLPHYGKV
jgi:hypothetical protein